MSEQAEKEVLKLPATDEERIKFREELESDIDTMCSNPELEKKLRVFLKMHHLEMMTRQSYANSLHNRELVYTAFKKDFPELKVEDFMPKDSETPGQCVQKFYEAHQKAHNHMVDAMAKATEHFNRSCQLLQQIDAAYQKDGGREKVDELTKDLIALHKGEQGTPRRFY